MRVTTVASVTEQNYFYENKSTKAAATKSIRSHTFSFTPPQTLTIPVLHAISATSNETKKLERTEHLPKRRTSDASSYYEPYSIATSSFTL